jgi:hypothetical protein
MAGPILGTLVYSADPTVLWWACGAIGAAAAGLALAARHHPAPTAAGARTDTVPAVDDTTT